MVGRRPARRRPKPLSVERLLGIFRVVSLLLAGAVFELAAPTMPAPEATLVLVCLTVEAWAIQRSYRWYRSNGYALGSIVAGEAMGVAFLVAVTGGIRSPLIWYALNPVLLAATGLGAAYCWLTLIASIGMAMLAGQVLFGQTTPWTLLIRENSSLILLFAMITMAMQLFAGFARKLEASNQELRGQREELRIVGEHLRAESERVGRLLHEIMALNQALDATSGPKSGDDLIETFVAYAHRLTGADAGFFLETSAGRHRLYVTGDAPYDLRSQLPEVLADQEEVLERPIGSRRILTAPVRAEEELLGLLGVLVNHDADLDDSRRDLLFLAKLGSIALERLRLAEQHDELVALAEQKRIAAEMHDRVAQRIFSLIYAFHSVPKRWPDLPDDLREHLTMLQESASGTLRELRQVIRQLADEEEVGDLLSDVRHFLGELEAIHQVQVALSADSDTCLLPSAQRRALLRVISEASANALRHGRAQSLSVAIREANDAIRLSVRDNGLGFDVATRPDDGGLHLGLRNIESLARRMGGSVAIRSRPGEGTLVQFDLRLEPTWGRAVR